MQFNRDPCARVQQVGAFLSNYGQPIRALPASRRRCFAFRGIDETSEMFVAGIVGPIYLRPRAFREIEVSHLAIPRQLAAAGASERSTLFRGLRNAGS